MTREQAEAIREAAARWHTAAYGVALIASVAGPRCYRECVQGLIDHRPSERDQRHKPNYHFSLI